MHAQGTGHREVILIDLIHICGMYIFGNWHETDVNVSSHIKRLNYHHKGKHNVVTSSVDGYYDWRDQDEPAWDNYGKYSVVSAHEPPPPGPNNRSNF